MIGQDIIARFQTLLGPKGVITDADDIAPWVNDWRGRFHGSAAAILSPASTQEVAETVKLATELGVPLVPQGGNTSMVGGATPPADGSALILSLRRMNRVRSLSPDDNLAICEAGVILSVLHDAAEAAGRRFPLSLGAKGSATIGGLPSVEEATFASPLGSRPRRPPAADHVMWRDRHAHFLCAFCNLSLAAFIRNLS